MAMNRRVKGGWALALSAMALAACSSCAAEKAGASGTGGSEATSSKAPAVHPVSGLPVIDLTVTHDQKIHKFRVEVARTGPEQEQGLMFRTAMGPDEGMIFPMTEPRPASFWMKNTVISLDIIFIGPNGRILNIAAKAIPYDESPLNSAGPVMAVLELNGGRAAELGIRAGDRVRW